MAIIPRVALTAAALAAQPAFAQPELDPIFGSHAVLQRDRPIRVTGSARVGEPVTVTLGNARGSGRADQSGRFSVRLPTMGAGGPYVLSVTAPSGEAHADDVLIGDVFLCSGQSNMELQVSRAQDARSQIAASADPALRLITIPRGTAPAPQPALPGSPAWAVASPDSVATFSAACFYMVKNLRRTAKVPIGAIASSWGGSRISTWMGDPALVDSGQKQAAQLRAVYARDPAAAARRFGADWEAWWRASTGDAPGAEPWQPNAAIEWKPVPRMTYWEDWGVPALADYNGMIWFSKDVSLTAEQARMGATLELGQLDDADQSWVNGKAVGSDGDPESLRRYPVPPGTFQAGRNVLRVNLNDVWARGGMTGPADSMVIRFADGSVVPIGSGWSYAVEPRRPQNAPRAPWDDLAGAGMIYNAMIAPLGDIGLKGVAWYQGESDVGIPGYADRLRAMMADWRRQFGNAGLPFAIVQIAPYGATTTAPAQSRTAELREQQRQVAQGDPHAALALTIDLGDPLDIHPGEKHEVGRRLARAMRSIAYEEAGPPSGPRAIAADRMPDGSVTVRFADVSGALVTRSSAQAIGFELCGARADDCRYATASVGKDSITLAGDGRPTNRVRYAWTESPVVNLYDLSGLPAGPFELTVTGR
ncbi:MULTISPECIES: sialate O-acetylesterase [Sphingobium]|uniref:sialate O-acetylesterase n=1 Tax=Sphingobium sp. MI1205 TaxID=407020 RepID=UPI0007701E7B|nr:sialate O-acetylesterase [Sphingobium sp. MI1205]AMK16604.1 putative sialic acid-specific 9-O-acetylesterase [Sphingobium sp. MI1205]